MTRPLEQPLYDNILVTAPDGTPLYRCNRHRADWYLARGLAEVESPAPLVIRLKFEPKGRGHAGDDFFLAERKNVCSVCGSADSQTRHHVVPYCFRRHFPEDVKTHNSHDVLPLCVACHDLYERHADDLKRVLAKEHDVHFGSNVVIDAALHRVKRHATALLMYRDRIPEQRVSLLMESLRDHYGRQEVTEKDIRFAARLNPAAGQPVRKSYGQAVVERAGDLDAFIKMWREHFLSTMNPGHMPPHWNVERKVTV